MTRLAPRFRLSWDLVLTIAFVVGSAWVVLPSLVYPALIGSHAVLYTHAAAAMLGGSDPWSVGPPIFAGPPTMPLAFMPFVSAPDAVIRGSWIAIDVAVAVWAIRRLLAGREPIQRSMAPCGVTPNVVTKRSRMPRS